jgi:hypothetical protein
MNTLHQIQAEVAALPVNLQAEVLDFVEFLRARQTRQQAQSADLPLSSLCGGLADSSTFAGSPVEIQERLRDEWR